MASKPFFDKTKGNWFIKWRSVDGWKKARLCPHPGWKEGDAPPKRPPADAVRLARAWEDRELAVRAGLDTESATSVTIAGFLSGYVLVAAAGLTDGSMRLTTRVIGQFLGWCKDQKIARLDQVNADVCRKYLAWRSSEMQAGYNTLKTDRAALSPAWSQAFQDGRVKENPWKRAPVPGKSRAEHPPFWTESEIARLVAVCKPWLADVVTVGAYAGLRITSLLGLTWDDINFAKGTIHCKAVRSKSGKPYNAPMLGQARDVLQRRMVLAGDNPLVFPGPRSGKKIDQPRTYKAVKIAVDESGIPDHGHYCHIFRHSFATMSINKGVPLAVVSAWLGHSTITMTQKYIHHDTRESTRWAEHFDSTAQPNQETPSP